MLKIESWSGGKSHRQRKSVGKGLGWGRPWRILETHTKQAELFASIWVVGAEWRKDSGQGADSSRESWQV